MLHPPLLSACSPRRTAPTSSRRCCWTTCRQRSTRSRSSPTSSPSPAATTLPVKAQLITPTICPPDHHVTTRTLRLSYKYSSLSVNVVIYYLFTLSRFFQ